MKYMICDMRWWCMIQFLFKESVYIAFYMWCYVWCGLMIYYVHCSESFSIISYLDLDRVWHYIKFIIKELGVVHSAFWIFWLWFWGEWNTCSLWLEGFAEIPGDPYCRQVPLPRIKNNQAQDSTRESAQPYVHTLGTYGKKKLGQREPEQPFIQCQRRTDVINSYTNIRT